MKILKIKTLIGGLFVTGAVVGGGSAALGASARKNQQEKQIENFTGHIQNEINKTYTVTVKGIINNDEIERLRKGVKIEDYITKPAKVKILKTDIEKDISRLEITIHEGKNRQVRKMCEAIEKKVLALHRSKIGEIGVKDLELGKWRYLSSKEIKSLINNN